MDISLLNIGSLNDLLTIGGLTAFITILIQAIKKIFGFKPLVLNILNFVLSFGTITIVLTIGNLWTDNNTVITAFLNAFIVAGSSSIVYETINSISKYKNE